VRPFAILEPLSVAEASSMLVEHGEAARLYAGGTELLLVMKEGLLHYDYLVNLKTVPGLDQVRYDAATGQVHIGALVTHRTLERSPVIQQHLPVLAQAESQVANVRVRNVGTIGGNLCFAEPHADPGPVLLLYGATVTLASATGQRELPLGQFFVDSFEVALEPGEILTEIHVPVLPPRSAAAYLRFAFLERPSVGVGVALTLDGSGQGVVDARIAVGCVGPKPTRMEEAEALLKGLSLEEALARAEQAGELAGRQSRAVSDLHGSAEYKEHLVKVLTRRAAWAAAAQLRPELARQSA